MVIKIISQYIYVRKTCNLKLLGGAQNCCENFVNVKYLREHNEKNLVFLHHHVPLWMYTTWEIDIEDNVF